VARRLILVNPGQGSATIEADRKSGSATAFSDIYVLVLPTLPLGVPTVASCVSSDHQAVGLV